MTAQAQPATAQPRPTDEMSEKSYAAHAATEPMGTCFFCWAGDRDRAIREIRAAEQEAK